jgi:hypothetical protein
MIQGPNNKEKIMAERTAREVRNVIYLNTLRGEKKSLRLYNKV